jgi:hypothetical protein
MQLPSFPTDNLYKFMAIAGLVAIVTAVVTGARQLDILDQQVVERYHLAVAKIRDSYLFLTISAVEIGDRQEQVTVPNAM